MGRTHIAEGSANIFIQYKGKEESRYMSLLRRGVVDGCVFTEYNNCRLITGTVCAGGFIEVYVATTSIKDDTCPPCSHNRIMYNTLEISYCGHLSPYRPAQMDPLWTVLTSRTKLPPVNYFEFCRS